MPFEIIRHHVQDHDEWKKAFDAHEEARREAGCHSSRVWRDHDDPDEITVLMLWDSYDHAKGFTETDARENTMAGGDPDLVAPWTRRRRAKAPRIG